MDGLENFLLFEIFDYVQMIADAKYIEQIKKELNKGGINFPVFPIFYGFRIKDGEYYLTIIVGDDELDLYLANHWQGRFVGVRPSRAHTIERYRLEYVDPKFFERLFKAINESSYLQICLNKA